MMTSGKSSCMSIKPQGTSPEPGSNTENHMLRIKLQSFFYIVLTVSLFFPAGFADAQEGGVVVVSKLIEGSVPGDDPWSAQWDQSPVVEFPMSAQVHWEPRLLMRSVNSVKVRSLHNGAEFAILLEYQDPEQDPTDAAAI